MIPVREVIKLLKLIKAETNTPGHYKQSLSGHILKNVIFLRQIKDFYLNRSSVSDMETASLGHVPFVRIISTPDGYRGFQMMKGKD